MRLRDKVVLVTGSSSGIGRGIAIGFAKEGAHVIVNYHRRKDSAKEVVKIIEGLERRAIAIGADVSNAKEVEKLVNQGWAEFGKIDILVNNSGITKECPLQKLSEELWDRILNVNLKGYFLCSQTVSRKMVENKIHGTIINISSVNAFQVEPNRGAYDISKGGINTLTKSLAVELGPYNIRVNGIALGTITGTNIDGDFFGDSEISDRIIAKVPLGCLGTVDDCVGPAIFLASDDSHYIHGETIVVDGGLSVKQY